jgi:hypothetical protein
MSALPFYNMSEHGYLARAKSRLRERTPEGLFYAAFQLRCCVRPRRKTYARAIEFDTITIMQCDIGASARRLGCSIANSGTAGGNSVNCGAAPIVSKP